MIKKNETNKKKSKQTSKQTNQNKQKKEQASNYFHMNKIGCSIPFCENQFTFQQATGHLISLECNHFLCTSCIKQLIKVRNRKCPICRDKIRFTLKSVQDYERQQRQSQQ